MFKYYLTKTLLLTAYLSAAVYSMWFWIAPVLQMHGLWRMLFVFIGTFIICFLTSFMFFSTHKPQATPKQPSFTDDREYQDYLNSLTSETIND